MKINRNVLIGTISLMALFSLSGCSFLPDVGLSPTSDAHANGVVLEDSRGSWNQVQLAETNDIFLPENQVVATLEGVSTNLTDEDLHSAANWVLKFVSSEGVDSIAADSTEGWEKWKAEEAPKYLDAGCLAKVRAKPKDETVNGGFPADRSKVIFNNTNDELTGMFVRGGQRVSNMGFDGQISSVARGPKKNATTVSGHLYVTYRVDNQAYIKQLLAINPLISAEQLRISVPKIFDNAVGQGNLSWGFNYTVLKQKSGGWKICETENSFTYEGKTN